MDPMMELSAEERAVLLAHRNIKVIVAIVIPLVLAGGLGGGYKIVEATAAENVATDERFESRLAEAEVSILKAVRRERGKVVDEVKERCDDEAYKLRVEIKALRRQVDELKEEVARHEAKRRH